MHNRTDLHRTQQQQHSHVTSPMNRTYTQNMQKPPGEQLHRDIIAMTAGESSAATHIWSLKIELKHSEWVVWTMCRASSGLKREVSCDFSFLLSLFFFKYHLHTFFFLFGGGIRIETFCLYQKHSTQSSLRYSGSCCLFISVQYRPLVSLSWY